MDFVELFVIVGTSGVFGIFLVYLIRASKAESFAVLKLVDSQLVLHDKALRDLSDEVKALKSDFESELAKREGEILERPEVVDQEVLTNFLTGRK